MRKTSQIALFAAALLALAGCGITTAITDTMSMPPVGNGRDVNLGDLKVQDLTVVVNEAGVGTVSVTMLNTAEASDVLIGATIDGVAATLSPTTSVLEFNQAVRFGFNSTNFIDAAISKAAGQMAEVTLTFAEAGTVTVSTLVVSADGYYAGVVPAPTVSASDLPLPIESPVA